MWGNYLTTDDIFNDGSSAFGDQSLEDNMARIEKSLIEDSLVSNEGNQEGTAKALGIKLPTLKTKMKKYGLSSLSYRKLGSPASD